MVLSYMAWEDDTVTTYILQTIACYDFFVFCLPRDMKGGFPWYVGAASPPSVFPMPKRQHASNRCAVCFVNQTEPYLLFHKLYIKKKWSTWNARCLFLGFLFI